MNCTLPLTADSRIYNMGRVEPWTAAHILAGQPHLIENLDEDASDDGEDNTGNQLHIQNTIDVV